MSKLSNIIIEYVKSCLVLNLIINLELVTSYDDEIYNNIRAHELTKHVPLTSLYCTINSINDKHFDVTVKQNGGKRNSRVSRKSPGKDQFEILINTEDTIEDLHQNNKKIGHNYKGENNLEKFYHHINKADANSKDRPGYDYTIEERSKINDDDSYLDLEDDSGQYNDYIDTNVHSFAVLEESDHDTDKFGDVADYNDDFSPYYDYGDNENSKLLHQDYSEDDDSIEQENNDPSKIFVIHPKDIQTLLNNDEPENVRKILNKNIPVNEQKNLNNNISENVLKLLNKVRAQTKTKHTVNLPKPIILEPLVQFQEQKHYEDNDKYEVRHESYKNQHDEKIDSKPTRIQEDKARSNKINLMYQKAEVKLKDINWLDILNKTIPVETDSESSEALTYTENYKRPSHLLDSLKYNDEYQKLDVKRLFENLKYNDENRNQDLTITDVLDKLKFLDTISSKSKDPEYKNQNISNKAYALDTFQFLDTIPTISKDPDDKNSLLLLNDINHLLHNTPISRKAQKYAYPKLMDILEDAYLLTVKVKNFIKEIHSLKNKYYGYSEEKPEELFKYYRFDPPRNYHDMPVEELAAMLINDIHVYIKRIYSPSARHEIIKKLGVINNKVKSVKKDLMQSLEQSIRKRKEMSKRLKNNKLLKEHFRKNWSDSINNLFGAAEHTDCVGKQNQEGVPKEGEPQAGTLQEGVPQEGTRLKQAPQEQAPQERAPRVEAPKHGAPQEESEKTKPTENQVKKIKENLASNDKPKDSENQEITAQEKEIENPKVNNEDTNSQVNKEEELPTENEPNEEPNKNETEKKEGKDINGTTGDAVHMIKEDKAESNDKQTVIEKDISVEITTEQGTTKGSTKKYRLPVYGLFDYWTYKKTLVEDECPEGTAKLKNECIRLPPH